MNNTEVGTYYINKQSKKIVRLIGIIRPVYASITGREQSTILQVLPVHMKDKVPYDHYSYIEYPKEEFLTQYDPLSSIKRTLLGLI